MEADQSRGRGLGFLRGPARIGRISFRNAGSGTAVLLLVLERTSQ